MCATALLNKLVTATNAICRGTLAAGAHNFTQLPLQLLLPADCFKHVSSSFIARVSRSATESKPQNPTELAEIHHRSVALHKI